jgi:hypothetical protein
MVWHGLWISLVQVSTLQQMIMKTSTDYTQNITFYPDKVVCVSEFIHPVGSNEKKKSFMLENRSTVYNGFMSPSTKRRVTKIITTWMEALEFSLPHKKRSLEAKKHYPVFVTLTLSDEQRQDDNFVKRKLLGRFITTLRRNYDVTHYFWRAEKQKNGRIHFHCIFDKFIHMKALQNEWNLIQTDFGYTDKYFALKGHRNPPSTHVEKIDSCQNAIDYVVKYVSKNPEVLENSNLKVLGRIWGCSDGLRELKPYQIMENSNLLELLNEMHKNNMAERFSDDFFTIYKLDVNEVLSTYFPEIKEAQGEYYSLMLHDLYNPAPEVEDLSLVEITELSEPVTSAVQLSLFLPLTEEKDSSMVDKLNEQH